MKTSTFCFTFAFAGLLSLAALGIGAAVDMPATLMSRADYRVAERALEKQARLEMAGCRDQRGIERDLCRARVRAEARVRLADLQARYHGTIAAAEEARMARVRAGYDVARARCRAHPYEERMACMRAAREDRARAMDDARTASPA